MQYELRYQVIEPKRQSYQNVIDRLGDQPASRYLEGTLDVQPRENFHYRPTWDEHREIYDADYSVLKLADPYSYTDPRQFYYTPYVTNRATLHDEFTKQMAYLEQRELLAKLPTPWQTVLTTAVLPLRHYESGAQMVSVGGARFAYGTAIEQCCSFAAFDRIGNAQMLSRVGIALGGGTGDLLQVGKREWLEGEHLQPLRRFTEEAMAAPDWAEGLVAIDLVDSLVYPVLYRELDEVALTTGAGAYSLFTQYLHTWFKDQRKWLDALIKAWATDEEFGDANREHLARIVATWNPLAHEAATEIARVVDQQLAAAGTVEALARTTTEAEQRWAGITGGAA
ncbi:phenol 2-monooxygenase [Amycolatopsis sp. FDAARGOS 1241]|uniref:phenol 2-monooxygenase n=1 Tax=Amycolatopsis sp. FDAARGOS 1241 TaxID=2778070 RepID=UPI0019514E4B|nr:phenol 2-monooxygenase [Amycolatopsis sp. FDAARGOS 1241]QRP48513.1 phenol 2-monooxygenase [Amycolatopsis sp. FDAARGOS 1241]